MSFKLDTKERFKVITLPSQVNSVDLTAKLTEMASSILTNSLQDPMQEPGNLVLSFKEVTEISADAVESISKLHLSFYENNRSFVCCEISSTIQKQFEAADLWDVLNITPTQSEAWDIVQMEEIERELLGPDEE
jgi:anti-anti-sigma regulatory factor